MPSNALIDTNVPVYAGGGEHPLRAPCRAVLALASEYPEAFVTDAEVLQELLHRYIALRRWPQGQGVFEGFSVLMHDRIEPIQAGDVQMAAALFPRHPQLSARDLVHAAVMQRLGISLIISADQGFEGFPGIRRLDPARLASWRRQVLA